MVIAHALRHPPVALRPTPPPTGHAVPAPPDAGGPGRLVAGSPLMRQVLALVERVAPTRAEVLVTGEHGTGKERVARLVHERSARAGGPLVVVHCAALGGPRLEAELFGTVDAVPPSAADDAGAAGGRVAEADGGTLLLHEVSALPRLLQQRLLHVLRTRQLPRAGGRPATVDVRLVATSSADLDAELGGRRLEEELYVRLTASRVALPPLRERPEDVAPLAEHFLAETAARHGLRPAAFSAEALRRMAAHPWPGNVRELRGYAARAAILHEGESSLPFDPTVTTTAPAAPAAPATERDLLDRAAAAGWDLARLEREYILAVLAATHGHQSRAAQHLGIDRRTLYRKLREYGVKG